MFGAHAIGWHTFGLRSFQQTLLSIALCGLIAGVIVGFSGPAGRWLENPGLQRIGRLSYGIYLFHNLAPLVAGKLFWFLWGESFQSEAWAVVRVALFAAVTWGLALASWRWIEQPLQGVRSRIG
jgi:peptidoglycan/LPS O-acetylase OafA/YrhL